MSLQTETRPGILVAIRDAIRGDSHRDFTQGSIGRAIFLLSLPMVLEMSMESLFAVVDMFWVAHLGSDAVATIALTEAVLTLLFAIAMGLSMATTAMVARRIGEKNLEGATEVATQSILLGVVIAGVLGAAGLYFAEDVLRIMGASPSILKTGTNYTRVIYGGSASVMLLFLINAVFRGAGDAALAMRALWIANIINIVLNPCLIFGLGPFPKMGVTGSGVGTTVGRTVGVLLQIWYLTQGRSRVVVHLRQLRANGEVMLRLIKLSIGGMFQYFVAVASWIALVRMAATFGSVAVAGYGVALRIVIFALLPSWGMSNAAATLVGQNLGAKRPDRAEQSVWRAGFYNMVFLGLISIAFIVFATPLVSLFTEDAGVIPVAANALRFFSYGYVFYAWGMVMVQAFNGAGDTNTPTLINLACYWAFQIPLAWYLSHYTALQVNGVFVAVAVAEAFIAVLGMVAFRRGTWKERMV
jgi:putative MATE family efflux protein